MLKSSPDLTDQEQLFVAGALSKQDETTLRLRTPAWRWLELMKLAVRAKEKVEP